MEAGGMGCAKVVIVHKRRMWFTGIHEILLRPPASWRPSWFTSGFEEKRGPGVEEYFAIFRCKQQSRPISYTYTVAALLRFAQSFANDFNIILTIGTTRRSRGVEWGIVTLRNKAYDRPFKACHRPTKDILFREYSRHSGFLRKPPILEYPGKLLVITFASLIPILVIPT